MCASRLDRALAAAQSLLAHAHHLLDELAAGRHGWIMRGRPGTASAATGRRGGGHRPAAANTQAYGGSYQMQYVLALLLSRVFIRSIVFGLPSPVTQ